MMKKQYAAAKASQKAPNERRSHRGLAQSSERSSFNDGSSLAQSRINEEDEESKHVSSFRREPETQSRGSHLSEEVSSEWDEEEDDEDILIKPKDLIVSGN